MAQSLTDGASTEKLEKKRKRVKGKKMTTPKTKKKAEKKV